MRNAHDAREEILGRIRSALPGAPAGVAQSYSAVPREYEHKGRLTEAARLDLLIDRLKDYDADVIEVQGATEIAQAVDEALARSEERAVMAAEAFPAEWFPRYARVVRDTALNVDELESVPSVLTTCEVAIASTGTIVLVHHGAQARRALTLLPDHHLCLVRRDQVVELLPEAFQRIAAHTGAPITTISGPSATSDIEMTRIRGVHGPRRLTVILYG